MRKICFLGIEGGGTRTRAAVSGPEGRILGRAEAGPSNPFKVGLDGAKRAIQGASRDALRRARIRKGALDTVCLGLSGIDRPAIRNPLGQWIRRALPARRHLLETDAAISLYAAVGENPGVLVVAGTGSIAYGRDTRGRRGRAGGWGSAYDDAGSGFDVGRKAILAALHAFDDRGPKTTLGSRLCRRLRLRDISHIVNRPLSATEIASLFPLVTAAARQGDRVAQRLLQEAGVELAELGLAVVRQLGWSQGDPTVVASGGVLRESAIVYRRFRREIRKQLANARVMRLGRSGVEGALRMAIEASSSSPPRGQK